MPEARPDCIFCAIVAGDSPAETIDSDEHTVTLMDINPATKGHALVIPRRHIATLNELTPSEDALLGSMIRRAAAIAKERGFEESGYRTVLNCNGHAGQSVFHIHLHVLGGRPMTWPPG